MKNNNLLPILSKPTHINEESFVKLLPVFFNELVSDYTILHEAIQKGEMKTINLYAHKIKGAAESYGASQLASVSKHIELNTGLSQVQLFKQTELLEKGISTLREFIANRYHLKLS